MSDPYGPGHRQVWGIDATKVGEAFPKSLPFFLETIIRAIKRVLNRARPTRDFGPRTSLDAYSLR